MEFSFDKIVDRKNTFAVRYDLAEKRGKPKDVLPLWIADMEFKTPECVRNALHEKSEHGIFGYSRPDDTYYTAVINWMKKRHNYDVKKEWIVNTPGVVFAISCAIRAFSSEGDGIIIQTPVYYPFRNNILMNRRKLVTSSLEEKDGKYRMNLEDFEQKIIENNVKLFILCSPHNPVGRVWTKQELEDVAKICIKHNVVIFADEIHQDFVRNGNKHTVLATISEEIADHCLVSTSASKSFNLAGLQFSHTFVKNEELRQKLQDEVDRTGYDEPNLFGIVATTAAYQNGEEWLESVKIYIEENLKFLKEYIAKNLPKVRLVEPEGTYLLWLDFSAYKIEDRELDNIIVNKAKLWLDRGSMFGPEGRQFQRINITCPRTMLEDALNRLSDALKS